MEQQCVELGARKDISYVQIFENRGATVLRKRRREADDDKYFAICHRKHTFRCGDTSIPYHLFLTRRDGKPRV